MIANLRNFTKSKLAIVLVAIIIIPFVFWGMGSVFSGGNTNTVAKINKKNISTKDFIDHINSSRIDQNIIKTNIEKNILEEILSELISKNLIDMEIEDFSLKISEKALADRIIKNKQFFDNNNKFSRVNYEKFLLENNITAPQFEKRLKKNELQRDLFKYINGGVKSPYFLTNKLFMEENKKINVNYINLKKEYKDDFSLEEINKFVKENEEKLKKDYIDLSYAKINPQTLLNSEEYTEEFFKKIDDIENLILNGENIDEIVKIYNLQLIKKDNYIYKNENDEILKEIYNNRNKKNTQIIEKNDFYLVYKIKKISSKLPDQNSSEFLKFIKNNLYLKNVYEFNQDLLTKIQEKKFKDDDFNEFIKKGLTVEKITINSINDDSIFDINSIKLLYTIPKNNFTLINDKENNIFIAKIIETKTKKILNNSDKFKDYLYKSDLKIKNNLYSSYDLFLNNKYQIKVYRNTLDRIKNYFR